MPFLELDSREQGQGQSRGGGEQHPQLLVLKPMTDTRNIGPRPA